MPITEAKKANVGKRKNWKVVFSQWAKPEGSTATSTYGTGVLDCTDVEFTSIGLPDPDENEVIEVPTSHRNIKVSVAKKSWQNWSKIGIVNDEDGNNWKEFVAAKELETTGYVEVYDRNASGGDPIAKFKCQVVGIDSGDGGADEVSESFTPTFAILEESESKA